MRMLCPATLSARQHANRATSFGHRSGLFGPLVDQEGTIDVRPVLIASRLCSR